MEQLTFQQAAVGFGFTEPECIKLKYSIWNNYTDWDFVETNDIIAVRHDAVVATNGQDTPTGGAMAGNGGSSRRRKWDEVWQKEHKHTQTLGNLCVSVCN